MRNNKVKTLKNHFLVFFMNAVKYLKNLEFIKYSRIRPCKTMVSRKPMRAARETP